ncbi:hypothetical protein SUGI_0776280 [Cryptomeria japonica]|nr:hypothetical protein SUGI_0776280 [Cryptomeria japonica]
MEASYQVELAGLLTWQSGLGLGGPWAVTVRLCSLGMGKCEASRVAKREFVGKGKQILQDEDNLEEDIGREEDNVEREGYIANQNGHHQMPVKDEMSDFNGNKVNISDVIGMAKDGALGQVRSKMIVILEAVAKDINIMRNDFEGRIKLLENTIKKVHKKLEMVVNVKKTTIQDSAKGLWIPNNKVKWIPNNKVKVLKIGDC